jgi:hypothetical protein
MKQRAVGTIPGSFVAAVGLLGIAAVVVTPVQAQTDTPTWTPTDTPTVTRTATPTGTPTSCRGDLPVVAPVMSPTNLLTQVIHFCGRIVGASSMSVSSEAGFASDIGFGDDGCPGCPNPGNASCNQGTVPLLPNQTNHIVVCQLNGSCPAGGCVSVDVNGVPLEIVQVQETPTPTATPTPTYTPTGTPTSCYGNLPVVAPVTSPTNLLEQVIHFCGRIVGSSSMSVSSEAGSATDITFGSGCPPCPATCNQGTVPLLPNQTNHILVCQLNGSCPAGGCVSVDVNGDPLEIVQVQETPTPTATPARPGDVGSPECLSAQQSAQAAVQAGGPYRNHGALVSTAAKVVSRAVSAGDITEACADCIVSQFARRIPVTEQAPCGEALGCCTFSGPVCTQSTQTACAAVGGQFFPGAFCAPQVGVCYI